MPHPTLPTSSPTIQRSLRHYTANGHTFAMVAIPKGEFLLGGDHAITFAQSYELGQYAVTQALWEAVMGEPWSDLRFPGDSRRPVERVSWDDIMGAEKGVAKDNTKEGFLHRLNALPEVAARNAEDGCAFALPSEAQWEYAARAGHYGAALPSTYAGSNYLPEMGWYSDNSQGQTHPVGRKYPNALGLYDMSGNVWEWCADVDGDYKDVSRDGSARITGKEEGIRVVRGGSWFNYYDFSRVAVRVRDLANFRIRDIGFRLSRYRVTL